MVKVLAKFTLIIVSCIAFTGCVEQVYRPGWVQVQLNVCDGHGHLVSLAELRNEEWAVCYDPAKKETSIFQHL